MGIIASDKIVYCSLSDGSIKYFYLKDLDPEETKIQTLQGPGGNYMKTLIISRDNNYLIGYVDIDEREEFLVFNLLKKELVWQGVLDLSRTAREDPKKLLVISEDCLNLYARSPNNKGITMYSLLDGSVLLESPKLHTNYIMQILVSSNGKKIVTCGKDKKIKVWDSIKQT